jgi:type VI secretion system protein ImpL
LKITILRSHPKYCVFILALVLFLLLWVGCAFITAWPWWACLLLVLIVFGLGAGALFARKLVQRSRERNGVQQEMERDEARRKKLAEEERSRFKDLQDCWSTAVETLKRSHLKKQGDPLQALPWYLVMGESGSGKTTAIGSARLSSPLARSQEDFGEAGTCNCQWSFLDQAILIDTAGRYTMPVDKERDQEEWQKVLSLLVKYRKRDPINGLIVTVAADKLINGSPQELENDGRQVRRRIEELMRVLGIKFPVYALITKCDLIRGMVEFAEQLPQQSLDQPMGVLNEELSTDVAGCLERFLSSIGERLKWLRLLLVHRPETCPVTAGELLFPDEVQNLKPGLEAFMRAAFQGNRYQDTPLLRGIYLGSGRQQQIPSANHPNRANPSDEDKPLNCTSRDLFLHDFFEKALPRDRKLLTPTDRTTRWKCLTMNLGLASWVLIGVALCGLLSYSFAKNMATIKEASAVISKAPDLKGDFVSDLTTLDAFRQMIATVEQRNLNWWIPRFGLNESKKAEAALKARFCRQFKERFLAGFDKNLGEMIAGFSPATNDDLAGRYLLHLSRRVNLLKERLDGAGPDRLRSRPLPSYAMSPLLQGDGAEITGKFAGMYVNYLVWREDGPELTKEVQLLQSLLRQLFTAKGGSLAWLVEFANRQKPEAGIALQSFWGGSRALSGELTIAPAFTAKGKEYVTALVNELSAAYPEPGVIGRENRNFENWYRNSCFAAWQAFAAAFPKGEERLSGAKEWQRAAAVMATDQGPYASFLKRAAVELEPFGVTDTLPSWLSQLYQYQALKTAGAASGVTTSAVEEGKRIADKFGKLVGKPNAGFTIIESQVSSAKLVQEYAGALAQISPVAKSRNVAQQMAQQVFAEDAGVGKTPFYQAADKAQRLSALLVQGKPHDEIFSRLISGPITFYGTFVRQETACSLQRQWEETVLKEVQGTNDPQTLQYLLSKDGPVWKFVANSVDPFIGWNPKRGYYSKTALGGNVPFEPGFYSFLAKGTKAKVAASVPVKQSYNLTVKGLPTDANSEARIKPQRTHLELQCATGPQTIDNMNYPVTKTLVWSPDSCSDMVFQIEIGDTVLTKRYKGAQGIADFLRDFTGGRRTFYPREFPKEKKALERMGVSFIRANYQLYGGHDILSGQASQPLPGQVPTKITRCWD